MTTRSAPKPVARPRPLPGPEHNTTHGYPDRPGTRRNITSGTRLG